MAGRAGQTLRLHLQHRARPLLCARERRHAITASWAGADPGPACVAAPPPPPQETDSAHLPAGGGARSGVQPGRVVVGLPGGAQGEHTSDAGQHLGPAGSVAVPREHLPAYPGRATALDRVPICRGAGPVLHDGRLLVAHATETRVGVFVQAEHQGLQRGPAARHAAL